MNKNGTLVNNGPGFGITRKEKFLSFIILAIIIAVLYANSLKNGFFFDDYTEFIENPLVQHPANILKSLLGQPQVFFQDIIHFRPVPLIYRIILYQVFQHNAFYCHLTNIILFLILCYLMFLLAYLLTRDKYVSLLSAMLFCAHPQNTTPVNFIIAHDALFYAIFCVLMTIFFIRYLRERSKPKYYVFSIFFYLLAILSHDIAVFSFTVLFLIAFYQQNVKSSLKLCAPYMLCAFMYYSIKFLIALQTTAVFRENFIGGRIDVGGAFFGALRLIGWYLKELIVPSKFVFMWSLQADPFWGVWKGLGVLFIIIMGVFLVFKNKKDPIKALALLWFFAGFLPVFFTMFVYHASIGLVIEPNWFIFSSIGFFLCLGLILGIKGGGFRVNILKYLVILFLMVYWGAWTIRYNEIWATGLTYGKYWLEVEPENNYALLNLGRDYLRRGDPQQVILYLNKILKHGQEHYLIYDDIGTAYVMRGQLNEGYKYFMKALSLNPQDSFAANNMGVCFDNQNNFIEAERYFILAIKSDHYYIEPLRNLGTLYMRFGKFPQAIDYLNRSLGILGKEDKTRAAILGKLIVCYYREGKYQEFQKALNLFISENPDRASLLNLIRLALALKDVNLAMELSKVHKP